MIRYRAAITVRRSVHEAFRYVSHFDRTAEWDPGIAQARMLTPEPVALGSRFALDAVFLGRRVPLEYEIVEYELDARVTLRAENAFVRSVDVVSFEADCGATDTARTVVTYDAGLEPKGLLRLARPLFALAFRRIGDRAADGLQHHLDAPHSSP